MINKIKESLWDIKQERLGLLNGKMGIALFFYYYSNIFKDKKSEQFADALLDELYESLMKQGKLTLLTFGNGLAGIGWCLEYFVNHRFCEGNTDNILKDVDDAVFKTVNEHEHLPINLQQGLTGYLLYVVSRLKNKKDNKKISTQVNQGLLIKIINKLDEELPNQFQQIGKEVQFDLLWDFPVLFWALNKALELDVYNQKITIMIEQWMFYLNTHLPGIQCHRLSLALSLHKINEKLKREDIDRQIRVLLFSINFDVLRKEINPYAFNLQHGWYGIILLLYFVQHAFDPDYPNYGIFEQFREEILALYKEKSEKEITAYIESPSIGMTPLRKGIINGLSGIGLVYLLSPKAISL
jgi:lantibiotic modifying enzyme